MGTQQYRDWKVLCWNIRGLNSEAKWNSIRDRIVESACEDWLLTNIYAPSTYEGKREFVQWLKQIQMPDHVDWLLVGDFNLMRSPENRNRPGGDVTEMWMFNYAICALG